MSDSERSAAMERPAYYWSSKANAVAGKMYQPDQLDAHIMFCVPAAFTPVCGSTLAMAGKRDWGDTEVFAVVTDSPDAVAAWVQQNRITIPVISDFGRDMFSPEEYDAAHRLSRRTLLVDGRGAQHLIEDSEHAEDHVVHALDALLENGDG